MFFLPPTNKQTRVVLPPKVEMYLNEIEKQQQIMIIKS